MRSDNMLVDIGGTQPQTKVQAYKTNAHHDVKIKKLWAFAHT